MNNIENYKKRFYNLMESTIGDVRPVNDSFDDKNVLSEDFSYIAKAEKGKITSRFGGRKDPKSGQWKNHAGIDIAHPTGTEVLAMADGVIIDSGMKDNGCGGTIAVDHGEVNGKKLKTRFCHNSKLFKSIGDSVKKGEVIALSGGGENDPGRGKSTGPHIHFEVYENGSTVNPEPYYNGTVSLDSQKTTSLDSEVLKNAKLCGWGTDVEGYKKSGWKCPKPEVKKTEVKITQSSDIVKQPVGDPYEYKKTKDGRYYTKKKTSDKWIDVTGTKFEVPIKQRVFKEM